MDCAHSNEITQQQNKFISNKTRTNRYNLITSFAQLLAGLAPGAVAGALGPAGVDGVWVGTAVLRDFGKVWIGQSGAGVKVVAPADADRQAAVVNII